MMSEARARGGPDAGTPREEAHELRAHPGRTSEARARGGPGAGTPRRVAAGLTSLALLLAVAPGTPASGAVAAAERERWDTRVLAKVESPGFPAYVFKHRNGRVYAGTYTNPQGDEKRSIVREWTRNGTLQRSWTVPGQDLGSDRGVQVASADRRGRLVLLEKSRSRVMTLNLRTGKFRRWATIPDLPTCTSGETPCSPNAVDAPAVPNFATWGPRGALYVSDYQQAVIWKIPRKTRKPRLWFASSALDGSEFGTTGIVFRKKARDLYLSQQSTATDGTVPTNGKLYRLPILPSGKPGELETLWTSLPGDLPDGFGIARSGKIYLANAGLTQQIVVLSRKGRELERFPEAPGSGDNGSPIPFDTPSSATFHGTRVLVANQSFTGNTAHHAILDVEVGERGRPPYLPRTAFWR